MKIAVFAGHGGSNYGASYNGKYEKDYTLEMALALTEELRRRGYTVVNNRTTDTDRSIYLDAQLANREKVTATIELHLNGSDNPTASGTETFYSVTGRGKELAEAINKNLVALGYRDRGVKTYPSMFGGDYLGIIRYTDMPAVLTEVFFITSENDVALYDPQKIAVAIANAVQELYPITTPVANERIADLQKTLNEWYGAGLAVDGVYGKRTRSALIKGLQTELNVQFGAGLVVDGIFGERTKSALPTLRKGARGRITYLMQSALYLLGYDITADGIYGTRTEETVKRFQTDRGLAVDGIAGKNTLSAIFSAV